MLTNWTEKIVKKALWRAESDDIYEILTSVNYAEKRNLLSCISDETHFSMNVRNLILKHARMSLEKIVNNKENIFIFKE